MKNKREVTFGSVCSGIEAAQLAFSPFGFKQLWSSEIADFPKKVLDFHYPNVPNVGDMAKLPTLIRNREFPSPDVFCGGTPCQAFSLAGWKNGLSDKRGQLTLTFIDIANAIDEIRIKENKNRSIILWENVEGVLNDKTNAFGNFIAGLSGYSEEIKVKKWGKSGFILGPTRNVAWRVIDAKHFGIPQQRRRLYVLAGGKNFRPDHILFEFSDKEVISSLQTNINKKQNRNNFQIHFNEFELSQNRNQIVFKHGSRFEFFREYTDCLYSAYGTKWNGNAAAYNGSLYVSQDNRIRRFTPLECERLMGFPDNYTFVEGNSDTNRYQAIGNSWAIPVVNWIGKGISKYLEGNSELKFEWLNHVKIAENSLNARLFLLDAVKRLDYSFFINSSSLPNHAKEGNLINIVETEIGEKFYLSSQACKGILRRKNERDIKMNLSLERHLVEICENNVVLNFPIYLD